MKTFIRMMLARSANTSLPYPGFNSWRIVALGQAGHCPSLRYGLEGQLCELVARISAGRDCLVPRMEESVLWGL